MLEPSKPTPSTQMLCVRSSISVSSETDMEKCCQSPGRSLNLRSTIWMLLALTKSKTFWASSGVMDGYPPIWRSIRLIHSRVAPILGLPAHVTFWLNHSPSHRDLAALTGTDADGVGHR